MEKHNELNVAQIFSNIVNKIKGKIDSLKLSWFLIMQNVVHMANDVNKMKLIIGKV